MKPNETELRQLRQMDKRLREFKEANFEACGYDASPGFLFWIGAIIVCPPLLLAWFIWEWHCKFIRQVSILFTYLKLTLMKFDYSKLLLVMVFVLMVLFILSNIFK